MQFLVTNCRRIGQSGAHRAWTRHAAYLVSMLMLLMTLSALLIPSGALAADEPVTSTVTVNPSSIVCGGNITITIAVANNGPAQIDNVTIDAVLPTGFSFTGATPTQGSGTLKLDTNELDFHFGNISSGSSANIVVTMHHSSGNGGTQFAARDNSVTWTDADSLVHTSTMPDPTLVVTGCAQDIAPTTTASATIGGTTPYTFGSWINQTVTVTLTPTDDSLGTGIAETSYILDNGSTQAYNDPIQISSEGDHTITFWSIDTAGNIEAQQTVHVVLDLTNPTVVYTGNQSTYSVDQTINITCTASDALSGLASDTCENIAEPAYTFAVGVHTFNATATDNAGNVGTGSTSFTVEVTPDSLCSLTRQFVSSRLEATTLCSTLADLQSGRGRISPTIKTLIINLYVAQISRDRSLTAEQKSDLIQFARAL